MSDPFGSDALESLEGVSDELEAVRDLAYGVSRTLTNAFRGAITEGRSLKTLLADIGRAFADIALKAALKPLGNLAGGLVENLFTSFNPALGGVKPFAKGGVIAAPTYFPQPGQWGLAGEAGPEAIMPLRRGADGRLGVAAQGGASPVAVTVNVAASDAASFARAETEIGAMLVRAVRRGTRGT